MTGEVGGPAYRTKHYRAGWFDRPFWHTDGWWPRRRRRRQQRQHTNNGDDDAVTVIATVPFDSMSAHALRAPSCTRPAACFLLERHKGIADHYMDNSNKSSSRR